MLIISDASMKGWGPSVGETKQGVHGQTWEQENILQLKAAKFAIMTFTTSPN